MFLEKKCKYNFEFKHIYSQVMNAITFHTSDKFIPEKEFCLQFLEDWMGIKIDIIIDNGQSETYSFVIPSLGNVTCADIFFAKHSDGTDYISATNIPSCTSVFNTNFLDVSDIPILYGEDHIEIDQNQIQLGIDIIGTIFFMLSRWEEIANPTRDQYDRFAASSSIASAYNFILRPIVDEYCNLLVHLLRYVGLDNSDGTDRTSSIRYSCDVDFILDPTSTSHLSFVGSILRTSFGEFPVKKLKALLQNKINGANSYDTFDFIFDKLHSHNVAGSFFFITEYHTALDAPYDFMSSDISFLLKKIADNDFDIGIHPSFTSYQDELKAKREFRKLREHAGRLSIEQDIWGGRQHFLRWDPTLTMHNWEKAGLDYDSTLGYADYVGFRTGTCHDHWLFDPIQRRQLKVVERPLMLMDRTLVSNQYMGYGYNEKSYDLIKHLKTQCSMYNGNFNFLWHNSFMLLDEDKELFEYCLA